jgi:hypothetical protein
MKLRSRAPRQGDSGARLVATPDALAEVLARPCERLEGRLDPASLFRAESACKAACDAALRAWPRVCARAWPHCAPADGAAARAACAAHGAATACPGAVPPRVDAAELTFAVHVSEGASATPFFVANVPCVALAMMRTPRGEEAPRHGFFGASPPLENLLTMPLLPVACGNVPWLRAALYVQRTRGGRAEVACVYADREPAEDDDEDEYGRWEHGHRRRVDWPPERPTTFRFVADEDSLSALLAAPKSAVGGDAAWSVCFDVTLELEYAPPLVPPAAPPPTARADGAELAGEDDEEGMWPATHVVRASATLAVETRPQECQTAEWKAYGYGDGFPPWSDCATADDLAVAMDSLEWHAMM